MNRDDGALCGIAEIPHGKGDLMEKLQKKAVSTPGIVLTGYGVSLIFAASRQGRR